jgi:hypothetical protein
VRLTNSVDPSPEGFAVTSVEMIGGLVTASALFRH